MARCIPTVFWRLAARTGLGGCGLLLTGCAAVAGVGAAIAAGLLTGLFLGRVQASFDATARSYGYTDAGSTQFVFNQPHNSNIALTHFLGRLPGFYFVLIDLDDKAILQSQNREPVLYATDVEIDFQTFPPTFTGTIREIDGDAQFPISEVYPEIESINLDVINGEAAGQYDVVLTATLLGVGGEELEYGLVWHARLSSSGLALEGDVEIVRVLTTADGEEIRIEGSGSLSTDKQ